MCLSIRPQPYFFTMKRICSQESRIIFLEKDCLAKSLPLHWDCLRVGRGRPAEKTGHARTHSESRGAPREHPIACRCSPGVSGRSSAKYAEHRQWPALYIAGPSAPGFLARVVLTERTRQMRHVDFPEMPPLPCYR